VAYRRWVSYIAVNAWGEETKVMKKKETLVETIVVFPCMHAVSLLHSSLAFECSLMKATRENRTFGQPNRSMSADVCFLLMFTGMRRLDLGRSVGVGQLTNPQGTEYSYCVAAQSRPNR
jgi:hypothetical protein